jgi:hypothetical protein
MIKTPIQPISRSYKRHAKTKSQAGLLEPAQASLKDTGSSSDDNKFQINIQDTKPSTGGQKPI